MRRKSAQLGFAGAVLTQKFVCSFSNLAFIAVLRHAKAVLPPLVCWGVSEVAQYK